MVKSSSVRHKVSDLMDGFSLRSLFVGFAVTLWLSFFLISNLWPTSYWFEVSHIYVSDTKVGEDPEMLVVRKIKRQFYAQWTVVLREVTPDGPVVVCTRQGASIYEVDAQLPEPLFLSWWAYPGCDNIKPGRYYITTTWKIGEGGFLPYKLKRVDSNIFTIEK